MLIERLRAQINPEDQHSLTMFTALVEVINVLTTEFWYWMRKPPTRTLQHITLVRGLIYEALARVSNTPPSLQRVGVLISIIGKLRDNPRNMYKLVCLDRERTEQRTEMRARIRRDWEQFVNELDQEQ